MGGVSANILDYNLRFHKNAKDQAASDPLGSFLEGDFKNLLRIRQLEVNTSRDPRFAHEILFLRHFLSPKAAYNPDEFKLEDEAGRYYHLMLKSVRQKHKSK